MALALKLYKSHGVPVTAAVHRILDEANLARENRDWTGAARGYREALSRDPALAHIWVQLGHALKEEAEYPEAEAAYRRAAELKPAWGEPHLHIGHVRKELGDRGGAGRSYLTAARLDPRSGDALGELHRLAGGGSDLSAQALLAILEPALRGTPGLDLGHPSAVLAADAAKTALADLRELIAREPAGASRETLSKLDAADALVEDITRALRIQAGAAAQTDGPTLVFDVSDLIAYFRDSRLPTGIQRVQIETITSAISGGETPRICCYVEHRDEWLELPPGFFVSLCRLSLLSGDRGAPDWTMALTRLQVLLNMGEAFVFPPSACLINLGTSWWVPNYFLFVREAKARSNGSIRYIPFVHDLIPIKAGHCCAKGLTQEFIAWAVGVFDHADFFLVNSEATKRDLIAVGATLGYAVAPEAVQVIPLDADCRKPASAPARRDLLSSLGLGRTPYVLFVSTIEARKNHVLAFDAWLELIRARGSTHVPKLVCVGKRGWLEEAVHAKLAAHEDLRERVTILSGLSDDEMAELYRQCLFTLYPSTYEGWGLPVTESLCYGKVPVISNGSSLPEAGGPFAVYFEAGSAPGLVQALERLIYDAGCRRAREQEIAQAFRPRTWREVAKQVIAAVRSWSGQPTLVEEEPSAPIARLGAYHPLGRNTETRIWPGMRTAEPFRCGGGWWGQDDWGCWTKPQGGLLDIALAGPHGPLRLYLRVKAPPACATEFEIQVEGAHAPTVDSVEANEAKWINLDLPACADARPRHRILLRGDDREDLAERTEGQDRRIISIGLAGFFLCEADDGLARGAFLEAVSLGKIEDLAFNRAPRSSRREPSPAPPLEAKIA